MIDKLSMIDNLNVINSLANVLFDEKNRKISLV